MRPQTVTRPGIQLFSVLLLLTVLPSAPVLVAAGEPSPLDDLDETPAQRQPATPTRAQPTEPTEDPAQDETEYVPRPPLGDEEPELEQFLSRAIQLMVGRVEAADPSDEEYPLLLTRLAEMYWQRARRRRLEAFDQLEAAREAEDQGNDTTAKSRREDHEALLEQADADLQESALLWQEIGEEFPLYEQADKALFFLAEIANELGDADKSREQYQALLAEHPTSEYAPQARLALADDSFVRLEDVELPLEQYDNALQTLEDEALVGYALYKSGWCQVNLEQPAQALERFQGALESAARSQDGALSRAALRAIVQTYAGWNQASPRRAPGYFRKLTDGEDQLREMRERLAITYEDQRADE